MIQPPSLAVRASTATQPAYWPLAIEAVQVHPESVLTPLGSPIACNFLGVAR